jgi:hypothetical protein
MEETLKLILDKLNSMDSDIKDMKNMLSYADQKVSTIEKHVLVPCFLTFLNI